LSTPIIIWGPALAVTAGVEAEAGTGSVEQ
jgi:hypothetical protein